MMGSWGVFMEVKGKFDSCRIHSSAGLEVTLVFCPKSCMKGENHGAGLGKCTGESSGWPLTFS